MAIPEPRLSRPRWLAAHKLRRPWVEVLDASKVAIAAEVLETLRNRLEDSENAEGADQD